jgi:hypothetical protein
MEANKMAVTICRDCDKYIDLDECIEEFDFAFDMCVECVVDYVKENRELPPRDKYAEDVEPVMDYLEDIIA